MPVSWTKTPVAVLEALGISRGEEPWLLPNRESARARRRGDLAEARRLMIERNDIVVVAAAKIRGGGVCHDCGKALQRDDICFGHRPPTRELSGRAKRGSLLAWRVLTGNPAERNVVVLCRSCHRRSIIEAFTRKLTGPGVARRQAALKTKKHLYVVRVRKRALAMVQPHCAECAKTPLDECVFAYRAPAQFGKSSDRSFGTGLSLTLALLNGNCDPRKLWRCRPLCHGRLTRSRWHSKARPSKGTRHLEVTQRR